MTVTNGVLLEKINGQGAILKRVEDKVDTYALNSVNPQVFELKIKELQVGIATNTVDILDLKKTIGNKFESERHEEKDKRSKTFGYLMALGIAIVGTTTGILVGYLLTKG